MAHRSERPQRLSIQVVQCAQLQQLDDIVHPADSVYCLRFPPGRTDADAVVSRDAFHQLERYCHRVNPTSIVCVLTTPPDAARLQPYLEHALRFQLWVAIKTGASTCATSGTVPDHHMALLIFSRYHGSLKHSKTRIGYTYCPACTKTTKDYGGKKHTYHAYGTLMSDVWRDIACDPDGDIQEILERLADVFSIKGYHHLSVLDLRRCEELQPVANLGERSVGETSSERAVVRSTRQITSRLIHDDCLKALSTVPSESVDFCFADPPYNLRKTYESYNDAREAQEYFAWCDQWLGELARVLKPGRTCAVLNIPLWTIRHYTYLSTVLQYQTWIVWEAMSLPVRMIMPAHYAILCFSKGRPRALPGLDRSSHRYQSPDANYLYALKEHFCHRAGCFLHRWKHGINDREPVTNLWWDIHRLKHNSHRVDHPCQLPPMLMRRLFALFTYPGEVLLDCFDGAGTSSLVAQEMGRRGMGIELSLTYHQLAQKRHEELRAGYDPFRKRTAVPQAKNSRVRRLPKQQYLVSKKILQLDVKRIADQLGHLPTREDVKAFSRYPLEYFEQYFVSWGEVCAAARTTGMSEFPSSENRITESLLFDRSAESYVPKKHRPVVQKIHQRS